MKRPPQAAVAAPTAAARGISADDAVLIEVLRECPSPCDETRALLAALDGGPAPAGPWADALLSRLGRR